MLVYLTLKFVFFVKEELKRLLAQNELHMKEMTTSWEQKLDAARKQWESEQKTFETKDEDQNTTVPYLQVCVSFSCCYCRVATELAEVTVTDNAEKIL